MSHWVRASATQAEKGGGLTRLSHASQLKTTPIVSGAGRYYRKFVPNYTHISAVLSDLLKKGTLFSWTPAAEQAFRGLKSRLSIQPVLRPPDYGLPFCLTVDASHLAVGATLFQVVDGLKHPICFFSRSSMFTRSAILQSRRKRLGWSSLWDILVCTLGLW